MKTAIITVAGISSRFNRGIPEGEKKLKAIYTDGDEKDTLLYHLLLKCSYADRIIVVGGYKYDSLASYCDGLDAALKGKMTLVYNPHFEDLASGYSLYLGLEEALKDDVSEVLFVEGDLDIDGESFEKVVAAPGSVLTYTSEPIYANKAVVLYKNGQEQYRYAFNSSHGLLSIDEPFSCILNSGQTWKFDRMDLLRAANRHFAEGKMDGTNLEIIQAYLDGGSEVSLIGLRRWTNCNTREDHKMITTYWEAER